ncbi:MAG: MBL fold metallo-hydrolase [Spirochaetes bacterium]|jgi:N-acyl-phosphatidylethanolamine-hydrolysing phospholipase D|nr:MBL fold metallo-hydrolase [Spirochaetota bacterium]
MEISFKWVGGATWILQIDNIKIACDPVLCPEGHIQDYRYFKTKRLNNPIYTESDFEKINLWLLTHNHEDHIDQYGLKVIRKNSTIISHKGLKPLLKNRIYDDLRFVDWNEETEVMIDDVCIKIKAIPAIHAKKIFFSSVVGNGNGYLLQIIKDDSEYTIYVTGDCVYNRRINKFIPFSGINLIIANAGSAMVGKSVFSKIIGRITNNANDIAIMNSELNPKIIIPVHWGTFTHYSETIASGSFEKNENIRTIDVGEKMVL